jgi:hypothetical protein
MLLALSAWLSHALTMENNPTGYCLYTSGFGTVSSAEFMFPSGSFSIGFFFQSVLPHWYSFPLTFVASPLEFAGPPSLCQSDLTASGSLSSNTTETLLFSLYHYESLYFSWQGLQVAFPHVNVLDGEWHHLMLSYDSTRMILDQYIDGSIADVIELSSPLPPLPPGRIQLGKMQWWELCNARFEDFRIFNSSVSPEQVGLVARSDGRVPSNLAPFLVLEYLFDDLIAFSSSSTVIDSSASGNDGFALSQVRYHALCNYISMYKGDITCNCRFRFGQACNIVALYLPNLFLYRKTTQWK